MVENYADHASDDPAEWVRSILDHVLHHVERESTILDLYTSAADDSESKALAYLVNLLVEDERRHHRLFAELAASLQNLVERSHASPAVPAIDFHRCDYSAVRALTEMLLQQEEEDARELQALHRELINVRDIALWDLLVEIMQRDTDKHIAVLRFIAMHTDGAIA
ncbi:MAG: hypothetical protein ACYCTL_08775 [Acidimicrobiales bacterium]